MDAHISFHSTLFSQNISIAEILSENQSIIYGEIFDGFLSQPIHPIKTSTNSYQESVNYNFTIERHNLEENKEWMLELVKDTCDELHKFKFVFTNE